MTDVREDYVSVTHAARDADRRARIVDMMSANVLQRYWQADPATLATGREWYAHGERIARRVGRGNRYIGAAVVAVLSPRRSWGDNIAQALAVGRGEAAHTMGDQLRKLAAIADGVDPDLVVGGRKVRSFWRNLDGDVSAVTCDIWALRAALDTTFASDQDPALRKLWGSDYGYMMVADAYRQAAEAVGETPRDLQAIVWIVERGKAS